MDTNAPNRPLCVSCAGVIADYWPGFVLCEECRTIEPDRPTLRDEAERLLGYWEQHGDNPEVVSKWAVSDMLGILRFIVEAEL